MDTVGIDEFELVVCWHLLGCQVDLKQVLMVVQAIVCLFQLSVDAGQRRYTGIVKDGNGGG